MQIDERSRALARLLLVVYFAAVATVAYTKWTYEQSLSASYRRSYDARYFYDKWCDGKSDHLCTLLRGVSEETKSVQRNRALLAANLPIPFHNRLTAAFIEMEWATLVTSALVPLLVPLMVPVPLLDKKKPLPPSEVVLSPRAEAHAAREQAC